MAQHVLSLTLLSTSVPALPPPPPPSFLFFSSVPSELQEEKEARIAGKGKQDVNAVAMAHVEILDAEKLIASDSGGEGTGYVASQSVV